MLKKTFDQPCLVITNLLARYVPKIGNKWLYKGYWQSKNMSNNFFSGLPAELFFRYPVHRKQVYIFFVAQIASNKSSILY